MNSRTTLSLSELRDQAERWTKGPTRIYLWLIDSTFLPDDHVVTRKAVVRLGGDPDALDPDYVGATAKEWDEWGPSTPLQFVEALEAEYGEKYDAVASMLTELGRELNAS